MTAQLREEAGAASTYAVRPLSIVPEGNEFLVGDVERGEFVLLPSVGVEVIRLLQTGKQRA